MQSNDSASKLNKDKQALHTQNDAETSTEEPNAAQNNSAPRSNSTLHNKDTLDSPNMAKLQAFNEDLIKLMVLLYQIDGKVTLGEQDYFDEVIESMTWRSGVSISAFINDAIHQTRVAIDTDNTREFLFSLSSGLNVNRAYALEVAMDISKADGNRSEDELELLGLLSNRVLAGGIIT